jgi:cell filamentation protein
MPEESFDQIADKYIEMNVAHPFMEGNGRSARLWLDVMLRKRLRITADWSCIGKEEYLKAMAESVSDGTRIKALLKGALADRVSDRGLFMRGIDCSWHYEAP